MHSGVTNPLKTQPSFGLPPPPICGVFAPEISEPVKAVAHEVNPTRVGPPVGRATGTTKDPATDRPLPLMRQDYTHPRAQDLRAANKETDEVEQ